MNESALARRLRELREGRWPDVRITQAQLRDAFGISVPLISSWESATAPKIPPLARLEKYAAFFATRRSIANGSARVLPLPQLTADEHAQYRMLLDELKQLRNAALRVQSGGVSPRGGAAPGEDEHLDGPWHFADGEPITIICSTVPPEDREKMPSHSPDSGDYIDLYRFNDLDSLFELHGHLRAANPNSLVTLRAAEDIGSDDLTTHVVLLGGVDFNEITKAMLNEIEMPVQQVPDWNGEKGPYFEVSDSNGVRRRHHATAGEHDHLQADVAFFYRGANPYNNRRTLTICNGIYARGVYGAVRALTDERFRDRNAAFVRERFGAAKAYSVLTSVRLTGGVVVTPDWTVDAFRLHEWPEPADAP
ncbi:helix-turn-helix transcriptional regulator [Actinomadura sp. ATCC 31491]|uniref:Helix-turn-helix transcriptional regulator n=1 Tax=Actinomadura luzonensis TaxID=2805427 RepID=A0ABT0GB14_9ACTN|nr:helix-turn-helix transcriptional regulator [Actinomadura luzonensis]MCK2221654.1 helix-turn-helix transcriptional regulator [Actinomadura luzonensis]